MFFLCFGAFHIESAQKLNKTSMFRHLSVDPHPKPPCTPRSIAGVPCRFASAARGPPKGALCGLLAWALTFRPCGCGCVGRWRRRPLDREALCLLGNCDFREPVWVPGKKQECQQGRQCLIDGECSPLPPKKSSKVRTPHLTWVLKVPWLPPGNP